MAMQSTAALLRDEDELEDSMESERAADRAREAGDPLWALVHYRKAAELRSPDPALEAKIAEMVAARTAAGRRHRGSIASRARRPSPSSLATLLVAGILTLGNVLTTTQGGKPVRNDAVEDLPVVAAAPSASASPVTSELRMALAPIEPPFTAIVESPTCRDEASEAVRIQPNDPDRVSSAATLTTNEEKGSRRSRGKLRHARRPRTRQNKPQDRIPALIKASADLNRC